MTHLITKNRLPSPTHAHTGYLPGASDNLAKTGSGHATMVMEGGMWLSASEDTIPSVSTKPFMGLRGPDVATSITAGPSASGARPKNPCEKKADFRGARIRIQYVVLNRFFNDTHIIEYIGGKCCTCYHTFVEV